MHLQHNFSLTPYHSFHLPCLAAHYVSCYTLQDITNLCEAGIPQKDKIHMLGEGTNTLFIGDFPGCLLHIKLAGMEVIQESSASLHIKAAAGVNWHQLVLFCIERNYGGVENLSLIPGSVGAAAVQNIGAYGVEFKDVVKAVEAIELATGKKRIFQPLECEFCYRTSIFNTTLLGRYMITAVTLQLHKTPTFCLTYPGLQQALEARSVKKLSFKIISETIIAIRKRKLPDPKHMGNAGSFFKNPWVPIDQYRWLKVQYPLLVAWPTERKDMMKVSAASLIEIAGFKGFRQGGVGVYKKHALILVHYGGGSGKELWQLAIKIQKKVAALFHITLLPEVHIVGERLVER